MTGEEKMTVLIVDDERYMIEYMKTLVDWSAYGFDRVLTAGGGSLARDLILEYRPELLITDIKMPKVSGIDLSALIDENEYRTKVIVISGYSEFEYAKQALRYGVAEYLVKPVLKADFVEALERILQRNFDREEALGKEGGEKYETIAFLKEYINGHFDQNLSLDALGEVVHLHPAYLSKIFKEVTDVNLSGYITDVRMQKAAELLEKNDLKVNEVMKRLGYQKSQYFSKLFKEKFGVTPKEYRTSRRRQ